jgi:hypothetical protein
LTDLATSEGRVRLREREATKDEIGRLLRDVCDGRALRLYRGQKILCPDATGPRIEKGDTIVELVRS